MPPTTDELLELTVGPVAHGGHCVARTDGRVVFVRHTLPGEKVLARLTDTGDDPATARFWRADAVQVLQPSPDRVPDAWPAAGPGGVGGGELAHVSLDGQHRWKAAVLAEQLQRLAHLEPADLPGGGVHVEAAPGDDARGGLHWRTRIELVAGPDGRAGMHRYRTHDVLALDPAAPGGPMPLATEAVLALADAEGVFTRRWEPGTRLELVAPAARHDTDAGAAAPSPLLLADGRTWQGGRADLRPNARRTVTETVTTHGTTWTHRVAADGFWQVHREAPALLVGAVLDALAPAGSLDGATVLDLYAGAGLFTLPLSDATGPTGRVVSVEGSPRAVKDARRSLHDRPHVELHAGPVDHVLAALRAAAGASGGLTHADAVVLDPPRVGAGRVVVEQVAHLAPQTVVYVACDPAALARDVALFAGHGYDLTALRALDLFPMTHHLEAVATLTRRP
ncbi:TRAM domain-containing protein [Luteimicrobium xylanilyticum]|uniref:Protein-L-isoaspartate(D-aspartate) O-methyltransferase n=1 Tax=Luteimicrobium xylanilyticum TaxID=1133546 RepID=A0A5P9QBK3_9MICO|nr:TRAM domain-containing protein [Luteimicrobium xylanilyticum]QFU98452.1 Protein-L-isoaspartate(D-aspartate) O-methyltransferase [Luteimicrobium xylanilyticum]